MKGFTAFLKIWPLHILLLPFFFIAGVYSQYAGLFSLKETLSVLVFVYAGLLFGYGFLYLLYRNKTKAGIAATAGGIFYLFFGHIKEALRKTEMLEFISHYKTLLPLVFILSLFLLYRLRKTKPPYQFNFFLNILFVIYSLIELWNLSRLSVTGGQVFPATNMFTTSAASAERQPDIYYILLDCYPNSVYQQEVLGVASNDLDKQLEEKGFYVVKNARSNYNYTSFSMASIFNMEYLSWLKDPKSVRPFHYNRTIQLVKNAVVFNWLKDQQYELHNLSFFDIPGVRSVNKEKFLSTTGREIILYYTFYKCLRRDVIPEMFPSLRTALIERNRKMWKERFKDLREHNRYVLDSLMKYRPRKEEDKPRFLYAHLEMPHFPYYFDSSGKAYPDELVYGKEMITNKERLKNYIGYTNRQASAIVDKLQSLRNGQDIIIIQSDHGLNDLDKKRKDDAFNSYTAFYFPDRDYRMLYDSMSNVNSFRIIFNKYFGQQLSLLKDSSTYIK